MPILFFVNCERTVSFSVKRDLDPPLYHPLETCYSLLSVNHRIKSLMIFISVQSGLLGSL